MSDLQTDFPTIWQEYIERLSEYMLLQGGRELVNDFDNILDVISQVVPEPEDYTGEDGLLYCGKCHTSKKFRMEVPPLEGRLLPHPCRCEQERIDREAAEQEASAYLQYSGQYKLCSNLYMAEKSRAIEIVHVDSIHENENNMGIME